ncbi:MAG: glycosyltransferase family 2 protein [Sphaerospermopsis sp. SIO1G1]|nr:glycosyltransferase family 2 protein [Sphaerospermopsis sp. SIO1G1]
MALISIIVPLYNKARYIEETIQSILTQTYTHWEMLIIDNGSTDGSWEIAQKIQDPRLRFFQSTKKGPGAARNYGLKLAQGNWIQFLDADDLLESDHIEKQLETATKTPQADIVVSYWQEFVDGDPSEKILQTPTGIGKSIEFLRNSSIAFCPWAIHTAIIKSSALADDCYWNEELDQYLGEDIAFWFKLIDQCEVAYGKNQGALYRTQTPQCRTQNLDVRKWFEGVHTAILANLDHLNNNDKICTPGQCESLIRLYSGMYLLAKANKLTSIQAQAINEANKWLNSYFLISNEQKIPMLLRRILGIPLFMKFSNIVKLILKIF